MILDEGIRALGEHGFNGLTVQALAKRCDISNAGLLYHFGSKDEILLAVLDELERRETELIAPVVAATSGPKDTPVAAWTAATEVLHALAGRFMAQAAQSRFAVVLHAESLDQTHPAHAWFSERERLTLDLFASLVADLVPHPRATARQILGLLQGLGMQWLRAGKSFDLLEEWNLAIAMLVPRPPA
jgi:AcrR family transcriptional regulator